MKYSLFIAICATSALLAVPAVAQTHTGTVTIDGQAIRLQSNGGSDTDDGNFIVGNSPATQFFWSASNQRWGFSDDMRVDGQMQAATVRVGPANNTASQSVFLIFGGTNQKLIFWDGTDQRFELQGSAQIQGTGTVNVLEILGGSDLSEQFDVHGADTIEPGSVVCIDPANPGALKLSSKAYDKTVAGVVSGAGGLNTGMMMGQKGSAADGAHPVALTGRVYVKVDATEAAIQPGDMLTTSDIPGHAMKALDHEAAMGAVIGKAMTPLAQGEQGLVLVLISLQ